MAAAATAIGVVLKGPLPDPTRIYKIGDAIELPTADFDQLKRWGYIRTATVAEMIAYKTANTPAA